MCSSDLKSTTNWSTRRPGDAGTVGSSSGRMSTIAANSWHYCYSLLLVQRRMAKRTFLISCLLVLFVFGLYYWNPTISTYAAFWSLNHKAGFHILLPYDDAGTLQVDVDRIEVDDNRTASFVAPLRRPPTFNIVEKPSAISVGGLDWYTTEDLKSDGLSVTTIPVRGTSGTLVTMPGASDRFLRFSENGTDVAITLVRSDLVPNSTQVMLDFAGQLR